MTTFNEILLSAYNTKWHKQNDELVLWNQMHRILFGDLERKVTQLDVDRHVIDISYLWPIPSTAVRVVNNYAAMISMAQRYKMIDSDIKVTRPKVETPRRVALSEKCIEQINCLYANTEASLVYKLLRDCGLRGLGTEVRQLTWASLNGGMLQVTSKKGGKHTTRHIPVPDGLNDTLECLRGKNSGLICSPAMLDSFREIWVLGAQQQFPDIVPYQLRHSYATRLLRKNVPLHVVQHIMGHADIKTTMTYAHVTQADIQLVRSSL